MVNGLLQIRVDRQIDVVACRRFFMIGNFQLFSHNVYENSFRAFGALQFFIHNLFDTGFANDISQFVRIVYFRQFFVFFGRYFSGITDDRRKINAVVIFTDIILFDIHALQIRFIFPDISHCLVADICGNCRGYIFLVAVLRQRITNYHNFVFHFRRIIRISQTISFFAA